MAWQDDGSRLGRGCDEALRARLIGEGEHQAHGRLRGIATRPACHPNGAVLFDLSSYVSRGRGFRGVRERSSTTGSPLAPCSCAGVVVVLKSRQDRPSQSGPRVTGVRRQIQGLHHERYRPHRCLWSDDELAALGRVVYLLSMSGRGVSAQRSQRPSAGKFARLWPKWSQDIQMPAAGFHVLEQALQQGREAPLRHRHGRRPDAIRAVEENAVVILLKPCFQGAAVQMRTDCAVSFGCNAGSPSPAGAEPC